VGPALIAGTVPWLTSGNRAVGDHVKRRVGTESGQTSGGCGLHWLDDQDADAQFESQSAACHRDLRTWRYLQYALFKGFDDFSEGLLSGLKKLTAILLSLPLGGDFGRFFALSLHDGLMNLLKPLSRG
jgi:hypothetical protein